MGPVTNLGQNESLYVQATGLPTGDELEVAFCSLAQGDQPVAEPNCAANIPAPPGCTIFGTALPCSATGNQLAYQYTLVTGGSDIVTIGSELDPSGQGDDPLVSQTADEFDNGATGTFFCDDGPDPCGIEVMDIPQDQVGQAFIANGFPPRASFASTSQNTVIFPLSWASTAAGCGSSPVLGVDTSYSAEEFLPAAAQSTCNGANGVAVLPTELSSTDDSGCSSGGGTSCPINDLVTGSVPVTFTDDPEDPATLAELKQAGGKFAYIPIAVSATEIAFQASAGIQLSGSKTTFPIDSYQLTPAMAAGVMTQLWTSPVSQSGDTDDDLCGQISGRIGCTETLIHQMQTQPVEVNGAPVKKPLDFYYYEGNFGSREPMDTAYALLNPWLQTLDSVPTSENNLGAMFPSISSGASYQATSWMCAAPRTKFSVVPRSSLTPTPLKDLTDASQILSNEENGPILYTSGKPDDYVSQNVVADKKKCTGLSALPTDYAGTISTESNLYQPSSSPLLQAHAIQGAITAYGANGGVALGAMDSSQADFNGVLPASLQNAKGNFVAPDQSSVDAALGDAGTNPDGTMAPNYDDTTGTGAANAYPLPMVTYALVSTAPQPASQAQELADLLTNLVTYSHAGGAGYSVPMPAGYYPLPDNLYTQAIADISNDIAGGSGGTSPGGASTAPASNAGGAAGTAASTGATPRSGTGGTSSPTSGASHPSGAGTPQSSPQTAGTSPGHTRHVVVGSGSPILVTLSAERVLLSGIWVLAIVSVFGGLLLLLWPSLRRHLAPVVGAVTVRWRHLRSAGEDSS